MRLLHIDSGRQMRGGQWQALYLVEGLCARGHRCILMARAGSPLYRAAGDRGLDVRPLSAFRLIRLSRQCDLVHAHDARSHTLAALFAGAPLVVTRRVAFPISTGIASRWKYSRATHFIAVSKFVKGILLQSNIDEMRITVVYDGVPFPDSVVPREARTVSAMAQETSDPAKGTDLLRRAAETSGIHIYFTKDLPVDLPKASIFVYITRWEGLGSAALLAMAAGAAVVASRTGGLPEIVEHEVSGLLTENDPAAIVGAIRRLLEDPALASRLAACGRARIQGRFSLSAMVDGTLAAYERIREC